MTMVDGILVEAIKDAVVKEQEAQAFYQKAADMVEKAAIKEFFLELKKDELGHEKMLTRLLEGLEAGRIPAEKIQDVAAMDNLVDMGISRYLKAKELKPTSNYQEAIIVAMKREEEAWRGYSKMANMSSNQMLKDAFTLLAQVEAGHLRRIESMYEMDVLEGY